MDVLSTLESNNINRNSELITTEGTLLISCDTAHVMDATITGLGIMSRLSKSSQVILTWRQGLLSVRCEHC